MCGGEDEAWERVKTRQKVKERRTRRGEETPILAKSSKILMARGSGVAAM